MISNEIYHHGVIGMHWGIRRYQPYPSGYRGDGKFIGRSNIKNAKSTRFDTIRTATLDARAKQYAAKRVSKAFEQYSRDSTVQNERALKEAKRTYNHWKKKSDKSTARTIKIVKKLQQDYGTKSIKDVPIRKGRIDGPIFTPAEIAARTGAGIAIMALAPFVPMLGGEIGLLMLPIKSVKALTYKVEQDRADGRDPSGAIETVINKGQIAVEDFLSKHSTRKYAETTSQLD